MNRTGKHAGTIILTGFEPEFVLSSVQTVITEHEQGTERSRMGTERSRSAPTDYTITNTSWRVLKRCHAELVEALGNTGLSNKWWGINE